MPNSWEIEYGLDPNDPSDASSDRDNDGLTAIQEYSYKTYPNYDDTDRDTLKDGWEINNGKDPLFQNYTISADHNYSLPKTYVKDDKGIILIGTWGQNDLRDTWVTGSDGYSTYARYNSTKLDKLYLAEGNLGISYFYEDESLIRLPYLTNVAIPNIN